MTLNIRLNVPYLAQCDNEVWEEKSDGYQVSGNVQCAATSNAMLLNFLKPELMAESESGDFAEFESFYKARFDSLGMYSEEIPQSDRACSSSKKRYE